jgi:hypothetical protein
MNKFPDKENIINLTEEEINNINDLIDDTNFIELKKLCKKYDLKCTGLNVKDLKIYLKKFLEKQHQGKFEYTSEGLKAKKLPELKKIMKENGIELEGGEKKESCIKKIVAHFKSTSSSKSKSKSKSPNAKKRNSIKNKFKIKDRVFIVEIGEYGEIIGYDKKTGFYSVTTDDDNILEVPEDFIKHISPKKSSPRLETVYSAETKINDENEIPPRLQTEYSAETEINDENEIPPRLHTEYSAETEINENEIPPRLQTEYSAETVINENEPEYINEEVDMINEYHAPEIEGEIIEDIEQIDFVDIEDILTELQETSVDNILDNNVRIKKTIQQCLAIGLM